MKRPILSGLADALGGRYTFLLIALLLMLSIGPVAVEVEGRIFEALILLILLGCFRVAVSEGRFAGVIGGMSGIIILGEAVGFVVPSLTQTAVMQVLALILFAALTCRIVYDVLSGASITFDTIAGALAAYMLLGLAYAYLYSILELFSPGMFRPVVALPDPEAGAAAFLDLRAQRTFDFVYFSFVTLTTLGYGDMVPVRQPARMWAAFEALIGQMYVLVLVASLVGIYASEALQSKRKS